MMCNTIEMFNWDLIPELPVVSLEYAYFFARFQHLYYGLSYMAMAMLRVTAVNISKQL